jgi:hypothetical protein
VDTGLTYFLRVFRLHGLFIFDVLVQLFSFGVLGSHLVSIASCVCVSCVEFLGA